MAKGPETKFKNRIRPILEALPRCYVTKIQQVGLRGDPDFLLVLNGRTVALELKRDGKQRADPLQLYKLGKARGAGAYAMVVSPETWPECYELLKIIAGMPPANDHLEIPTCLRLPSAI